MSIFKLELSAQDQVTLQQMQLDRFAMVLGDPRWYEVAIEDDVLLLDAKSPEWVDTAIRGLSILSQTAYNILGIKTICLRYVREPIMSFNWQSTKLLD